MTRTSAPGKTPLTAAILGGNLAYARQLIRDHGSAVEDVRALRAEGWRFEAEPIRFLCQATGTQRDFWGRNELIGLGIAHSLESGNQPEALELHKLAESIQRSYGYPKAHLVQPLISALRRGKREEIQTLLAWGACPILADNLGQAALRTVDRSKGTVALRLLLDCGVAANQSYTGGDFKDFSLLMAVAQARNSAAIDLLLNSGAKIESWDGKAHDALWHAVVSQTPYPVRMPVKGQSWIPAHVLQGNWPAMSASWEADSLVQGMAARLAKQSDIGKRSLEEGLRAALSRGLFTSAQALLNEGAVLTKQTGIDDAFLIATVKAGNPQTLRMALDELKSAVDIIKGELGYRALQSARRLETAELLLQRGAQPNPPARDTRSPLALAVEANDLDLVGVLLRYGAKPDEFSLGLTQQGYWGSDAEKAVALLLKHGSDPLLENGSGLNFVLSICTDSKLSTLKILAEGGIHLDRPSKADGWRPLMEAARWNQPGTVQFLLEHGADPAARNAIGETAGAVARRFQSEIVAWQLATGAPAAVACVLAPLKADEWLRTTLCEGLPKEILDYPYGAGRTALWWACKQGNWKLAKTLHDKGADPRRADREGITPLQMASRSEDAKAKELVQAISKRDSQRNM